MKNTALLRGGYGALGIAFACLAAGAWIPGVVIPGLLVAFVGAILLAFCDDDHPKWAGIALIVYFLVTALAFVIASGATINIRGQRFFVNDSPPEAMATITNWITLFSPLMLASAGIAAAWDRERPPRVLLAGAIGGFLLVALLSVFLAPDAAGSATLAGAADEAEAQGRMLQLLFAVSAATGALGALWAASRPDSY